MKTKIDLKNLRDPLVDRDISRDRFFRLKANELPKGLWFDFMIGSVNANTLKTPEAGSIWRMRINCADLPEVEFKKIQGLNRVEEKGQPIFDPWGLFYLHGLRKHLLGSVHNLTSLSVTYVKNLQAVVFTYQVKFPGKTVSEVIAGAQNFQKEIEAGFGMNQ